MAEITRGASTWDEAHGFAAGRPPVTDVRQLSLVKDGHRYLFRYPEGEEESLIQVLMEMAGRTDLGFDWFDAAVLSRQVNEKILRRLDS